MSRHPRDRRDALADDKTRETAGNHRKRLPEGEAGHEIARKRWIDRRVSRSSENRAPPLEITTGLKGLERGVLDTGILEISLHIGSLLIRRWKEATVGGERETR